MFPDDVVALRRDAQSGGVAVSTLLRRLRAIARDLGRSEYDAWIEGELHGFAWGNVPEYRRLQASLVGDFLSARNRITGYEIPDAHLPADILPLARELRLQPGVPVLEELQTTDGGQYIRMPLPSSLADALAQMLTFSDGGRLTAVGLRVGKSVIPEIQEHVRSEIDRIAAEWVRLGPSAGLGSGAASEHAEHVPSDPATAAIRYCWRSRYGRGIVVALGGLLVLCLVAKAVRDAFGAQ